MLTTEKRAYPAPADKGATHRTFTAARFSRNELFVGLVAVGFANGISERVGKTVTEAGITAALASTFDISVIVWVAWGLCIVFLLRSPVQPVSRSDGIVTVFTLMAVVVPVAPLSWLALTGLALHILWTSPRASLSHRAAWILLAVTVPMFWTRLLFAALSDTILQADAVLVARLMGTYRVGNAIQFVDGSGYLWIAPACSSLANMSLAVLCWVTATKVVHHRGSMRDIGWIALSLLAVVAINVSRISLIGFYPAYFDLIHGPVGATVASWLILGTTVTICLLAVQHDRPAQAAPKVILRIQPGRGAWLGLLLAISLFLKFTSLALPVPAPENVSVFPDEISGLLQQKGFHVSQENPANDLPWVVGRVGECSIRVTEVAPQGWQQGLLAALAEGEHLAYVFGGAIYSDQPTMRTRADYYWTRLNRYLRRNAPSRSVLAVISTSACEVVPLRDLADLSSG